MSKKKLYLTIFLIVFLLAAFFRIRGLNWDQGFHMHPDERMITMVTEKIKLPQPLTIASVLDKNSSLNPKFFPYGSFPIYLLKSLGWIFSYQESHWAHYSHINLIGRSISALTDLLILILIFKIAKKLWSKKEALLAVSFYALSVFSIQAAHFYAVDTLLTFFILLTLYRLIVFYEKPCFKNAISISLFFGLALATKISATVLIVSIGFTTLLDITLIMIGRIKKIKFNKKAHLHLSDFIKFNLSLLKEKRRQKLFKTMFVSLKWLFIIGITTIIVFIIFEPYALLDFDTFWAQTKEQQAMTKSAYTFPYTLQYVGTLPYIYHLKNLVLWGMGPLLGISSIIAFLFLSFKLIKDIKEPGNENKEAKILILVIFTLVYFLVVGRFAIKFMRYLLPLYPLLCLYTAWFFIFLTKQKNKIIALLAKQLTILTILTSLIWAIAFLSIYSKENTRVLATKWIQRNIKKNSFIAIEHWDDRIPISGNYQFLEMPMYEDDRFYTKWKTVNDSLIKTDYIILASNRLYTPLQKLADCNKYQKCYPKTAVYYESLFNGKLGFSKVAEFTSYPRINLGFWSLEINDSKSDESFTVYDHPKIMIFKKTSLPKTKLFY